MAEFAPIMPGRIEGWDELRGFTIETIGSLALGDYPENDQIRAVVDAVSTLDNEQLEHARYYSLGHLIGALEAHLANDDNRDRATELAGALLTEAHQDAYGKRDSSGLHLSEFTGANMHLALLDATQIAAESLPLDIRLMADSLHLVSMRRKTPPSEQAKLPGVRDIRALNLAILHVGTTAPVASTNLYRRALMDAYAIRKGISTADVRRQNPLIRKIKGVQAMRNIDMLQFGSYLARLRLDEINEPEITEEHISRTPTGVYSFDHSLFNSDPKPPKPITRSCKDEVNVIHAERIGCPALYVPRMIRRILSIIPEVALLADAEIRGELG